MEIVNSGLIYGLEFQCRALASLESDDDAVRFVVGTQGPQASNQIHSLQLCDDDTPNLAKKIWNHPQGELWQISANKCDHEVICARYTNLESDGTLKQSASVYRLKENENMTLVSDYSINCKDLSHVSWLPGDSSKVQRFI